MTKFTRPAKGDAARQIVSSGKLGDIVWDVVETGLGAGGQFAEIREHGTEYKTQFWPLDMLAKDAEVQAAKYVLIERQPDGWTDVYGPFTSRAAAKAHGQFRSDMNKEDGPGFKYTVSQLTAVEGQ